MRSDPCGVKLGGVQTDSLRVASGSHTATGGVAGIAPAGAHRIEVRIGSGLPLQPRCEAEGVEGQAATGGGVVSDWQAERRWRRRGAFRRGA